MRKDEMTSFLRERAAARILIVGDVSLIRELLLDLFQEAGYIVVTATDGLYALEVLSRVGIDIVVSDYDMPQMNGIDLSKRVSHLYPDIPFLLFSARLHEMPPSVPFIQKPFSNDAMLARVAELLNDI
jgi:CheY-like chemotaxis protein